MSLRRFLVWAAAALAVALLGVAGGIAWLLTTTSGARRAVAWLESSLEGLSVGRVEGRLEGPFVLHGVRYRTASLALSVETLRFDWRPGALLRRRLDVTQFEAKTVRVGATGVGKEEESPAETLPDLRLPLNVVVRHARIDDVRVAMAPPSEPFVLDSVRLATSDIGGTVRIDDLEARGPGVSVRARGTLRPQGEYPVDLEVAWALERPGAGAPWSGSGRFDGSLENLRVIHDLKSPVTSRLEARVRRPIRAPSFEGSVSFRGLETRAIAPSLPPAIVSGRFEASGSPERFETKGLLSADVPETAIGRIRAELDVERSGSAWTLDRALLTVPGTPSRISVAGKAHLAREEPVFEAELAWSSLRWPLRGEAGIASPEGRARLSGTATDYTAEISADVSGAKLPPGRWRIRGRGNRESFDLASLTAEIMNGTVRGQGRFDWAPRLSWQAALSGENLDPSAIAAEYPGHIRFDATSRGRIEEEGPTGVVELATLRGTLRDRPIEASAAVDLAGGTYRIRQARANVASAHLQASGSVGRNLDLRFALEAPKLGDLIADAAGSLRAQGNISGTRDSPRLIASASGTRLSLGDRRAERLRLEGEVGVGESGPTRLDVDARDVVAVAGQRPIDAVTLSASGTRAAHTLRLRAAREDRSLAIEAALAGGFNAGGAWNGEIRTLELDATGIGRWSLASAAGLAFGDAGLSLTRFCWTSSEARICADGKRSGDGAFSVDASIHRIPLGFASPWLPPRVALTGRMDGEFHARRAAGGPPVIDAFLSAPSGEIRHASDRADHAVPYGPMRLEASSEGSALRIAFDLPLPGLGAVDARARLPRFASDLPMREQPVEAHLRARLDRLAVLEGFLPAEDVRGKLTADWSFDGTLGDPRPRGALRLMEVSGTVPDTGVSVRDASLTLLADGTGTLSLEAVAHGSRGELRLAGRVPLAPSPESPVAITITGDRFLALDTYERLVEVTPDLRIAFDGKTVSASGEIRVPTARFEYLNRLATVPASTDVVVVGREEEETRKRAYSVEARVRLILGDHVRIKAMGFVGRVEGSLLIIDGAGRDPTATGELTIVEGTYKAYGTELTIERGLVRFAGPVKNPSLDIKAHREAEDGTIAGITVVGPLRKPEVRVYSEPPMSESEALAYLILGHPLDQATPAEGSLVANVASSAGIAAGNILGKKVAKDLGLETLRVDTEQGGGFEEASLVVGKYLSPSVYLEYGIGLLDQASQFRVSYIINRHWTLRGETGESNGGDVIYTIEP